MVAYNKNADELVTELATHLEKGLSGSEVQKRAEKYGPNKLKEKKKKTNFQRFVDQFKDAMIEQLVRSIAQQLEA